MLWKKIIERLIRIGSKTITNQVFADDIKALPALEQELEALIESHNKPGQDMKWR